MDYSLIAQGPKEPLGRQRVSMTARYESANSAAIALMLHAKKESEAEITRGRVPPGS